jgi:hypothetical protein
MRKRGSVGERCGRADQVAAPRQLLTIVRPQMLSKFRPQTERLRIGVTFW